MRGQTISMQRVLRFVTEECCNCGVLFAMTEEFHDQHQRNKGSSFYCPNGHNQHYVGKTDAQKLAECRTALAAERDQHQAAQAETKRLRAEATRLRKRVANGVCPCCKRSYVQLARHMKTKHPSYATRA